MPSPPAKKPPLERYAAKRDAKRTLEPAPDAPLPPRHGPLLFVIQQHAARRLHFDLRLELDGVLKSWAVPKGLTQEPGVRHLAVEVEDHPFAYGSFEGVIPAGGYGAGAVIVWDCGTYAPEEHGVFRDRAGAQDEARAGLAAGRLHLFLRGQKLKGAFVLVRTHDTRQWLILKQRDRFARADAPVPQAGSVLSDLTLEQMAADPGPHRMDAARLARPGSPEVLPAALAPMLAQEGGRMPADAHCLFEPKLDGYRVLAFVEPPAASGTARVRLRSRGGVDLTAFFPEVVRELAAQGAGMVLDGEIVALGDDGRPSFNAVQKRAQPMGAAGLAAAQAASPAVLVCFDLPHFAGVSLRSSPYEDRRRWLMQTLLPDSHLQLIHADPDREALYAAALASGHEGILAKRLDSRYLSGRRSDAWLKIKATHTAELVVGGYTQGLGARAELGALLLGYWRDGELIYAGHVGSGLAGDSIAALRPQLAALHTQRSPFAGRTTLHRPTRWLRPELVVEVRFPGWTAAGLLRAPVFVRARPDVAARAIARPESDTGQG